MDDYIFTPFGGVVQQMQSIIEIRHNGSIESFAMMPSIL